MTYIELSLISLDDGDDGDDGDDDDDDNVRCAVRGRANTVTTEVRSVPAVGPSSGGPSSPGKTNLFTMICSQ